MLVNETLEQLLLQAGKENLTEKQKKIITAAVEMFAEKGYAATSTSEIAKKAGVAEGTIFRHYKTKKELLVSIVAPTMARLFAPFIINDLNKVLDGNFDSFEDFLRAMIKNRMAFARNNLPLLKIVIQEIPFHPELKEQFMEHIAKKVFDRFLKIICHFQAKGELIDIPSYSVIRMAASAVFGHLMIRFLLVPEFEWNDEEEAERTVQFILHGLSKKE
ncbi:TetR family transcriptional regulator [Bacillus sp. M6-12]|uniref:TetR/AcrR family transcriptional regulator n=1 Tax=Bacillus sp. M6-12 TaxID=2054166 RepID=UPI000C788338|nr:TetR/AcrR family transcriptional regulator [Bacillus sp. M6-12]PLS18408.1 TetR family transcriptional regulator [Bacillus sp. M6-12]